MTARGTCQSCGNPCDNWLCAACERATQQAALNGEILGLDPLLPPGFIDAADLLARPDPGPTPWLVDGLVVARAIIACVGRWKTTKSYSLLDLCISCATGEPAFGALAVPQPGPVVYICEESGEAALWRRLDSLCRGRGINRERLRGSLVVAANIRRRLDDEAFQHELLDIGARLRPCLFVFDPLARMKAHGRAENEQTDMSPVLDFFRLLRDETQAAVAFVHHTGHNGSHMRGTSDLETVWETRLEWEREGQSPEVTIKSEHREAEAGEPVRYRVAWDHDTRTMRFPLIQGDVEVRVRAYLADHPDASANGVIEALRLKRQEGLKLVKKIRGEGGSQPGNHPGTTTVEAGGRGGSPDPPFRGSGTTTAEPSSQPVPTPGTGAGVEQRLPEREQAVCDNLVNLLDAGEVQP